MAGAAIARRVVYVVGGQEHAASTTARPTLYALSLDAPERGWRAGPPLPGPGRILPVVAAQGGALYVMSGASLADAGDGTARRTYLTDAWRYTPETGWTSIAAVPHPVVAAPVVAVGQAHVLVLGGDDGEVASRAGGADPSAHPGFRRDVLAYHTVTDTWVRMGTVPAGLVTTVAVTDGASVWLAGGEDRPRHRSSAVFRGTLQAAARTFGVFDYVVLVAYFLPLVWIGRHFSGRNATREDFFLGGRRVPWWAAGLSIYATQLSAITFLAIPAKAYAEDWTYLPGNLSILLIAPIVVAFYLPRFRGLQVTTAYEYLEHRFSLAVRLLCSFAFIALQGARMAIVLYLPALALAAATGIDVYVSILLMGGLCTLYTRHGGMHAVIWTDVLQTVVLLGAVLVSVALIVSGVGSLDAVVRLGAGADKFRMAIWTPDLTIASVWVVVIGNLVSHLVPYTADQAVVQRYFTTRDEAQAARAVWLGAAMAVPGSVLFFAVGTALFAFYRTHPGLLHPASPIDATFSWFIAQQLPSGVSGLVVAGVFAAAMSTLSGSINSIVTALVTDFADRLGRPRSEAEQIGASKWLTLVVGGGGTLSALALATWDVRSLWDLFLQALGLFGGGLAGIFALGIFTRRAHGRGALVGFAASALVLALVQQRTPVHFLLYAGIGTASAFVLGYLASLALPVGARRMAPIGESSR